MSPILGKCEAPAAPFVAIGSPGAFDGTGHPVRSTGYFDWMRGDFAYSANWAAEMAALLANLSGGGPAGKWAVASVCPVDKLVDDMQAAMCVGVRQLCCLEGKHAPFSRGRDWTHLWIGRAGGFWGRGKWSKMPASRP